MIRTAVITSDHTFPQPGAWSKKAYGARYRKCQVNIITTIAISITTLTSSIKKDPLYNPRNDKNHHNDDEVCTSTQ